MACVSCLRGSSSRMLAVRHNTRSYGQAENAVHLREEKYIAILVLPTGAIAVTNDKKLAGGKRFLNKYILFLRLHRMCVVRYLRMHIHLIAHANEEYHLHMTINSGNLQSSHLSHRANESVLNFPLICTIKFRGPDKAFLFRLFCRIFLGFVQPVYVEFFL